MRRRPGQCPSYTPRVDFDEAIQLNRALVKVAKRYRAAQAERLAELGLHAGQDVLLRTLGQEREGLLVSELADRLGVESPTVTRSLARLEPGGWTVRHQVPGDRRAVRVRLSPRGHAVLERVEAVWRDLAELVADGLSDAERSQLVELLQRVEANLREGAHCSESVADSD